VNLQLNSFNEQASSVGEPYAKAAADAMKAPFGVLMVPLYEPVVKPQFLMRGMGPI